MKAFLLLLTSSALIFSAPAQSLPPIQRVFVIMMENTDWPTLKRCTNAPFITNVLLPMGSHCESYNNLPDLHPSLPNYIWIEAGTNFDIFDDYDPGVNHQDTTDHLVTLLNNAGVSWKAYQENISGTSLPLQSCCGYSARHNPFLYFDDVTGTNDPNYAYGLAHIRPYSELEADLTNNNVARYNFIIPSDCDDMHSPCVPPYDRVAQGDAWLATEVPKILNSAAYSNAGALFIAWDESETTETRIPLILVSPYARGGNYGSTNYYDHSSLLKTFQDIFRVGPLLGGARNATNLGDLFMRFGFSNIEKLSTGAARLTLAGLTPGRTNIVEVSSDLSSWFPIQTNVASATSMAITDAAAKDLIRRFYRFVELR